MPPPTWASRSPTWRVRSPRLGRRCAARCGRSRGRGWCLRAESLLSDRLDDVLDDAGAVRLDVHLRNCPRCVDHERRLIQAQNALVAEFGREPADRPAAELTLVQPAETPSRRRIGA